MTILNFLLKKLRPVWHLLYWGVAFIVLMSVFSGPGNYAKIDVIYTILFMSPIITGVYLTLYLLIPRLLKREKILFFLLCFLALTFITAVFIFMMFDKWIDLLLKNYYFISYDDLSTLLVYSFTFLALSTLLKLSKEWIKLLQKEKEEKLIQLISLQSQINPHFLLNSLQTIYSQSLHNSALTSETILRLSEILKFTLYESEVEVVELERELEIIKAYIEMQDLRMDPERAKISISIKGDPEGHEVIPMLFLPFIENSFKHGLQGSEKEAFVNIEFSIINNLLEFTIENNAGTFDQEEKALYSGIGIENTKKRLELFYHGKYNLSIEKNATTFIVILKLELN